MVLKLTPALRQKMNEAEAARADLAFARRIRAFRPGPVRKISDDQLATLVGQARAAARGLGIQDPKLVSRFVMVHVLIAPGFYQTEDFAAHFRGASGSADLKIGDVFRLVSLTMRSYGRSNEVWW